MGPSFSVALCGVIEKAAAQNDLPFGFFTRLIWQESRFDASARSPAGAEGVAQFMPGTASSRGLLDPFEPTRALYESAAYLNELRQTFGNLGLAAAAYNAGPGRIGRWISGHATLPLETIDYVETVTGHSVVDWNSTHPPSLVSEPGFSCLRYAESVRRLPATGKQAPTKPWAVILVGSFQKTAVLAEYRLVRSTFAKTLGHLTPSVVRRHLGGEVMMKYVVQIEEDDRQAGDKLCKRLEVAGGNCIVLRNILR